MARTSRSHGPGQTQATTASRLHAVERRLDDVHKDVATIAVSIRDGFHQLRDEMRVGFSEMRAEMRGGFAGVDRRFDTLERRLDELTDVVDRIYTEHGQRLKNLEDHFTTHSAA